MKERNEIFGVLRRQGRGQYALLAGCLFFASLLITALSALLYSPTVQNALPQGGDSRKQVMAVFVLVLIGCTAFSVYAAGLFFRYKSREVGILLALGMARRALDRQLLREVLGMALSVCGAGLVLGTPLCWGIWAGLRHLMADRAEMQFQFTPLAYGVPAVFALFVLAALAVMERRFLRRVNVLDIIQESHRAEPVRSVPRWYGWGGVLLILVGMLLGYCVPYFCVMTLHWYAPPIFTAPFYLPVLIGLYWVLLYTVVVGWHRGKSRTLHLIENSMMQFQGRQTVHNMVVVTVLVAGAYFASFYVPMAVAPGRADISQRPRDYSFFWRADQPMLDRKAIEELAAAHQVEVVNYVQADSASLAVDGEAHVEQEGPMGVTYTSEYREEMCESRFFSVSGWNALTGDDLTLAPGQSAAALSRYGYFEVIRLVTNPVTGQRLQVSTVEQPLRSDLFTDVRVLNDQDYEAITQGLTPDWQEQQVVFDAKNDSYAFSKELFRAIVAHTGAEAAVIDGYDRIVARNERKAGRVYFLDPESPQREELPSIDLADPDSREVRMDWQYMPRFRMLDQGDFVFTTAVFLMLFVFVALLCFAAVLVILFTRSQTLILVNAWVYEDLHKLGASRSYLRKTSQGQVRRAFLAPIVLGTTAILGFFMLILAGNGGDGLISPVEWAGLGLCFGIVAVMSLVFYGLYRLCVKKAWQTLGI